MIIVTGNGFFVTCDGVMKQAALESKKLKVPRHQMLYTRHVEVILIPSHLALDAPVNEEKKKFNLLETEQKSHSDSGL